MRSDDGELGPIQKEILRLLIEERLTPKSIAKQRKTSLSAIYQILKKLKEKGYLDQHYRGGLKIGMHSCMPQTVVKTNKFSDDTIRLHAQELHIRILHKTDLYEKSLGGMIFQDGNRIRCFKDTLEIYAGEQTEFYASTEQEAESLSLPYWENILVRLENRFHISIIKNSYCNIKIVKEHFAKVKDGIAKDYKVRREHLEVQATEDGKLWLIADFSKGAEELETIHPETSKDDMRKVRKQTTCWRNHDPPTQHELDLKDKKLEKAFSEHKFTIEENLHMMIQANKDIMMENMKIQQVNTQTNLNTALQVQQIQSLFKQYLELQLAKEKKSIVPDRPSYVQ